MVICWRGLEFVEQGSSIWWFENDENIRRAEGCSYIYVGSKKGSRHRDPAVNRLLHVESPRHGLTAQSDHAMLL